MDIVSKPINTLSYKEKIADNNKWGKNYIDYLCSLIQGESSTEGVTMEALYDAYNGRFPNSWFRSVTDPISAVDKNNTYYPARIRPTSILRTNLDLLQGEFIKRPFKFQVLNLSEDAYFSFEENKKKELYTNLTNHFNNARIQEMIAQGMDPEEAEMQVQETPMPEDMMARFPYDYRDYIAEMGQGWLENAVSEYKIWEVWKQCFKDWIIVGRAYTYKAPSKSSLNYWRVSPLNIKHEKSETLKYIEDREWTVANYSLSLSELIDLFYDKLKVQEVKWLEESNVYTRSQFVDLLRKSSNSNLFGDKYDVQHCVWKSKKRLAEVMSTDPVTGQIIYEVHDEEYEKKEGEKVTYFYVNEFWGGWRISDEIYVDIGPIPMQRNELNNLSYCKGPYNGVLFSDTHSEGTSVLKLGLPLQVLYLIVQYKLEEAIAQNMGKIAIIDQNVIPKGEGWNEEKFFYTARSKRFMVINRNQFGADRSFNQYQALDMGTFQDIAQMIDLLNAIEEKWDNLIGISRQRKAQVQASDSVAGTQAAMFQSSVITEIIFDGFREFMVAELQGLLDCSKLTNIDGLRKVWQSSDLRTMQLEIDPDLYCNASLQVHVVNSTTENEKLDRIKTYLQAFAQNGMDPQSVINLELADSIAEVKELGKRYSDMAAKQAQAQAQNEEELAQKLADIEKDKLAFESSLKVAEINAEYDRKDGQELIKADVTLAQARLDSGGTSVGTDIGQIEKNAVEREKMYSDQNTKAVELQQNKQKLDTEERLTNRELDIKEKEIESKERTEKLKARVAIKNKVSGEK